MPSTAFEAALPFVLRWEGGFVDHPNDPGGRTNKGVTQKVYDAWRRRQGLPQRDVKMIEHNEVLAIYEGGYWIPPRCDLLERQLDLVHFDTAVNMSARWKPSSACLSLKRVCARRSRMRSPIFNTLPEARYFLGE